MASGQQSQSNGTHSEISHEHSLAAEPVVSIGGFEVTNSLLSSWIVVFLLVVFSLIIKLKLSRIPTGIQNAFEMFIEKLLEIFDAVTGSRETSVKFFPFIFAFFIYILLNNWLGILPGVGSIGGVVQEGGEKVFVPLFRGGTADLNTTLSLAIIGVVGSHIFGVLAIGAWKHLNKFINIQALLDIPKKIRKDPTILIVNPIQVFIGLVEIISELSKIASLSFRLFGNIFAGEVLLASMSAMLAFGLPLPFLVLEIFVGVIQALIFAVLVLSYLAMHTSAEEH
ncbi:MAG: F0F1 ATP synthase subunit A [Candidatus Moraniibacteriota bacterium]